MSFVTLSNLLGSATWSKWLASWLVHWRDMSYREGQTDRQTERQTDRPASKTCQKITTDDDITLQLSSASSRLLQSLKPYVNNRWWHYFAAVFCFKPALAVSKALCLTRLDIVLSWTSGICQSSWWLRETAWLTLLCCETYLSLRTHKGRERWFSSVCVHKLIYWPTSVCLSVWSSVTLSLSLVAFLLWASCYITQLARAAGFSSWDVYVYMITAI